MYHLSFDVACLTFATFFEDEVARNKAASVHIALPCSSYTFAAEWNGCALRSLDQACGVDGLSHDLRMKDGNRVATATVNVLTLCLKYYSPVSLANPKTSCLWRLSEIIGLCNLGRAVDFNQCAFGSPWRKYTRLLLIQCDWLT